MVSKKNVFDYIKIGAYLHIFSTISIIGVINSLDMAIKSFSKGNNLEGIIATGLSIHSSSMSFLSLADAKSRYYEYEYIKDKLEKDGWSKSVIRPFTGSACQRYVLKIASKETGHLKETLDFYNKKKYAWYHIPVILSKNSKYFFTKQFWKDTFFVTPEYIQEKINKN